MCEMAGIDYPLPDSLTGRELEVLGLIADGCSNHDIAQQLVLSLNTVKWYSKEIYSKLGVNSRTQAVKRARQLGLLELAGSGLRRVTGNLPLPITPFVGRQKEQEEIVQLLHEVRLLTLTGPGGIGKTCLALQVARQFADECPDGVWFIPLSDITDPALVTGAVAQPFGVRETPKVSLENQLRHHLRNMHSVILFDNFEHVLPAAALVSSLLADAPSVKVLVTSRQCLGVYGEQVYQVGPLDLPVMRPEHDLADLAHNESIALFVRRAQAVRHDFSLTQENARIIADICIQLEGWPIALELAAAHLRVLTPQSLLQRLEEPLEALDVIERCMPYRHQTLRRTLDWSLGLLESEDRLLFVRLGVFRGGCTLDAVEAICCKGLPTGVYKGLLSLVDKSLVKRVEGVGDEPRFTMLRTVHQYAEENLDASPEGRAIRLRAAEYYAALAETAEAELHRPDIRMWLARLEQEHTNFRAILARSIVEGDENIALRLGSALAWFWYLGGYWTEGRRWLGLILEEIGIKESLETAKILNILAGGFLFNRGEFGQAKALLEEALAVSSILVGQQQEAWSLGFMAAVERELGLQSDQVQALQSSAFDRFEAVGDLVSCAWQLNSMGETARLMGDYAVACDHYTRSLEVAREIGDQVGIIRASTNLGRTLLHSDHYEDALELFRTSLMCASDLFTEEHLAHLLTAFAWVLVLKGQYERAARLFGTAEGYLERAGAQLHPADLRDHQGYVAKVKKKHGEERVEIARNEGRDLLMEEAIACVIESYDCLLDTH